MHTLDVLEQAREQAMMLDDLTYATLKGRQDDDYRNLTKEIDALALQLRLGLLLGLVWLLGMTAFFLIVLNHLPAGA